MTPSVTPPSSERCHGCDGWDSGVPAQRLGVYTHVVELHALLAASEAKIAQLEADVQTAMMTINRDLVPRAEAAEASLKAFREKVSKLAEEFEETGPWEENYDSFFARRLRELMEWVP